MILKFAKIEVPITKLLRNDCKFEWTEACQQTIEELRFKLSTYLVLRPLDWDKPLHVFCDARNVVVALCQSTGEKGNVQPIAYVSKQLTPIERELFYY